MQRRGENFEMGRTFPEREPRLDQETLLRIPKIWEILSCTAVFSDAGSVSIYRNAENKLPLDSEKRELVDRIVREMLEEKDSFGIIFCNKLNGASSDYFAEMFGKFEGEAEDWKRNGENAVMEKLGAVLDLNESRQKELIKISTYAPEKKVMNIYPHPFDAQKVLVVFLASSGATDTAGRRATPYGYASIKRDSSLYGLLAGDKPNLFFYAARNASAILDPDRMVVLANMGLARSDDMSILNVAEDVPYLADAESGLKKDPLFDSASRAINAAVITRAVGGGKGALLRRSSGLSLVPPSTSRSNIMGRILETARGQRDLFDGNFDSTPSRKEATVRDTGPLESRFVGMSWGQKSSPRQGSSPPEREEKGDAQKENPKGGEALPASKFEDKYKGKKWGGKWDV